jgi:GNAT superfamily N-acetyltransferase
VVPSLDPACASAVAALEHDPFYRRISQRFAHDNVRRRAALAEYFDFSIRQGTRIGRVVHLEEAGVGVAVWLLPQSAAVAERERLQKERLQKHAFLLGVLGEQGCIDYHRMVEHMGVHARTIVGGDAWYLSIIAVAPQAQGRGLGVRLLTATLAEADAAGAVCYLETFSSRSMKFYERLGFVAREAFAEPTAQAHYTLMVRPSRDTRPPWRTT